MAHDVSISHPQELRPIRVGAIAQQPNPALTTILYVGLSSILPGELHVLCSCAGLVFSRVLRIDGDQYHLEVAALPHYFSSAHPRRGFHVRSIVISFEDFAQLLEYDRSLAGKATCDMRELVEEHVAEVIKTTKHEPTLLAMVTPVPQATQESAEQHQSVADAYSQGDTGEKEDADLEILTSVHVPRIVICQVFAAMNITAMRERRVQSALLAAALEMVDREIEQSRTWRERDQLKKTYEEIQEVQQWRRMRRNEGYGWQRVVTLQSSGVGWDLVIGMPA